jgi:hypothetical protein
MRADGAGRAAYLAQRAEYFQSTESLTLSQLLYRNDVCAVPREGWCECATGEGGVPLFVGSGKTNAHATTRPTAANGTCAAS